MEGQRKRTRLSYRHARRWKANGNAHVSAHINSPSMSLRQIVLVELFTFFLHSKKIRSAQRDSRNARRVVTCPDEARRAMEEERACGTIPFSAHPTPHTWWGRAHLISWCTSLPTSSMGLFPRSTLLASWVFRDFSGIVRWA